MEMGTLSLVVLIWIGVAVLWSMRLAYRRRGATADDPVRLVLTIAGWTLILVGILGTATQALAFLAPLAWIIIADTMMTAVAAYRHGEQRALVRCLAAAAERGIPLEQAARAFSLERSDELGIRAARLAEMLEAGMPLSLALAETRTRLPTDLELAVRLGVDTGDFSAAVATVAKADDDADNQMRSMLERFFYLAIVALVLVTILTFVMLKIVPVFARMFEEFALELPVVTQLCITMSEAIIVYWPVFLLPIYVFGGSALLRRFFGYLGLSPWIMSIFGVWHLRQHSSLVMRSLALAVRQQRPIASMVWLLAQHYPRSGIRRRIETAANAINHGQHWSTALRRLKLLRRSDEAVLLAAERSGNLQWALQEMADSNVRSLTYRLRIVANVLFPLVLFVFGLVIGFVVISLFMPLVSLIQGMTSG